MNTPARPRTILVGIDGSPAARTSLQWATALAKTHASTISAVMAWNYPSGLMMPVAGTPVVPAEYMADRARTDLAASVASVLGAESVAEQRTVMGSGRIVLTELSNDHDLLVVGRTGKSRLQRMWLGSTAAYCVRHAHCPVAIIRESVAPEQTITVAVDGSPASIDALVWALGIGDEHAVRAVFSHDEWELDELAVDDSLRADLDDRADAMLTDAIREATERAGVDLDRVTRQIRQGDPRTTIVDNANPSDLLVLGAQGHAGLARWVLGSLADYAVHHAPGSVVICR